MQSHFHQEERTLQNYLEVVRGKAPRIDEMIENLLQRSPENAVIEGASNLIDLLLTEACKRERIDVNNDPGIGYMSDRLVRKKNENRWVLHKRLKAKIDGLRFERNDIVHRAKVDVSIADVKSDIYVAFSIIRWFYERYYRVSFSDSLHIVEIEQNTNPLILTPSGNKKPSRREIKDFKKAFIKEVELIGKRENWDKKDAEYLDVQVNVKKNHVLLSETNSLFKHLKDLVLLDGALKRFKIGKKLSNGLLLLGEPGSGKSILMRKIYLFLCKAVLNRYKAESRNLYFIPIYIHLRDWNVELTPSLETFIFNKLVHHKNPVISSFIKKHFKYNLKHSYRNFFFLLDGFDEIPTVLSSFQGSTQIDRISEEIQRFINNWGNKCLIASRKFKRPSEKYFTADEIFYIQPIKEEAVLEAWYGKYEFEKLRYIYNSPSLRELMKVPLTISFIKEYLDSKGKQLPKNTAMLYAEIVDRRLHKARLEIEGAISKREVIECAKCIASYQHDTEIYASHFGLNKSVEALVSHFPEHKMEKAIAALKKCRLARVDKGRVIFIHRSIHDYFFAMHLMDTPFELEKQYDIDNRNAYVLYLEICNNSKKLQSVFDYCWKKIKKVSNENLPFESTEFKEGLFYMQYIIDGFKGKLHKIEKKQNAIISVIIGLLADKKNLIAKKYALKCTQLLLPENRKNLVEKLFWNYDLHYTPYLSQALVDTTKLMKEAGHYTQGNIQLECKNRIEMLMSKVWQGYQIPDKSKPFILTKMNNVYHTLLSMKLYPTQNNYANRITFRVGGLTIVLVFLSIIHILFIIGVFLFILWMGTQRTISWYEFFNGVVGLYLPFIMIYFSIKRSVIHCLLKPIYKSVIQKEVSKSTVLFGKIKTNLFFVILGISPFIVPNSWYYSDFAKQDFGSLFKSMGIASILFSVGWFYFKVDKSEAIKFYEDYWLLRKKTISKKETTITRERLAELFSKFKTTHFRTKFMKRLRKRNIQIDPETKWPDGKLPNVDDDEASGIIAEMEESLLGLSQY